MQKKYILGIFLANILVTIGLFGYISQKQNLVQTTETIDTQYTNLQNSLHTAAETTLPAVVGVFSDDETSIIGTAFFVDNKGYLLTSKHILQDSSKSYSIILQDKKIFNIDKVWMNPNLDLAIFSIQQDKNKNQISFPVLSIKNDQTPIRLGQLALTIGTPFSQYANTVSLGIVSALHRELTLDGMKPYTGLYQLDINTNPGNSGGPVITPQGEVFGLVTAMASQSSHIGFAIPLSQKLVLEALTSFKNQ